jgi:sarcosine oxidase subunit gamma
MGARWGRVGQTPIAMDFGDPAAEGRQMRTLGLCDLSPLAKLGVKGRNAEAWLCEQGLPIPERIYDCRRLDDHGLCIRVSVDEFFIEGGPAAEAVVHLTAALASPGPGVWPVVRQDATLLLTGSRAIEVLAQTCSINFRQAPDGRLIMTRLAGVSCAVLPQSVEGVATFRLWIDPSYAVAMWETLSGIVAELDGGIVGAACLYGDAFG